MRRLEALRYSRFLEICATIWPAKLPRKRKVVTPVIDEVYAMLYESKDMRKAVQDLTARESKAEDLNATFSCGIKKGNDFRLSS